jgi:SAM-dependent methyltransferase
LSYPFELYPTRCAVCQTENDATQLYPGNVDEDAFNPTVFSARRMPDRLHYRMVKCSTCGLVRSDPIADPALLARLYAESSFTYAEHVGSLVSTYGRYLAHLADFGANKRALLEIGCGNGFFLEEALRQGYGVVRGVEPSTESVAKAGERLRPNIVCDVMRPGLFLPGEFDVVCMFQVLDHIPDPAALLQECFRLLKPGGLLLALNHNVEAFSARLLRDRSPIVDVEHTYLFSPATISKLLSDRGFIVRQAGTTRDTHTIQYLTHLIPLPALIKRALLGVLERTLVGRIRVRLSLGNLFVIAQKPHDWAQEA